LQVWDKSSDDIKYSATGVLVKGPDGQIKQHRLGPREPCKGSGVGAILGLAAAPLPGVGLLDGVIAGAARDAAEGELIHEGPGLVKADPQRYAAEMDAGHAAVGIMAAAEAQDILAFLILQRDFHYYETFDFFGFEPCC